MNRLTEEQKRLVCKYTPLAINIAKGYSKQWRAFAIDELVSTAFLGLVKAAQRYRDGASSFAGWARDYISWEILDMLRHEKRPREDLERWQKCNHSFWVVDEEPADARGILEHLFILRRLRPREQEVLRRRLAGETLKEIDQAMGVSGTSQYRERIALRKLGVSSSLAEILKVTA